MCVCICVCACAPAWLNVIADYCTISAKSTLETIKATVCVCVCVFGRRPVVVVKWPKVPGLCIEFLIVVYVSISLEINHILYSIWSLNISHRNFFFFFYCFWSCCVSHEICFCLFWWASVVTRAPLSCFMSSSPSASHAEHETSLQVSVKERSSRGFRSFPGAGDVIVFAGVRWDPTHARHAA